MQEHIGAELPKLFVAQNRDSADSELVDVDRVDKNSVYEQANIGQQQCCGSNPLFHNLNS